MFSYQGHLFCFSKFVYESDIDRLKYDEDRYHYFKSTLDVCVDDTRERQKIIETMEIYFNSFIERNTGNITPKCLMSIFKTPTTANDVFNIDEYFHSQENSDESLRSLILLFTENIPYCKDPSSEFIDEWFRSYRCFVENAATLTKNLYKVSILQDTKLISANPLYHYILLEYYTISFHQLLVLFGKNPSCSESSSLRFMTTEMLTETIFPFAWKK